MTKPYFRYWGKSSTKDSAGNQLPHPNYHLLAFHSLDVAAVGYELLSPNGPYNKVLAQQLGVDGVWLQNWFSFCLVLHDLGKFCSGFQQQCAGLSDHLVREPKRYSYELRHDALGYLLLKEIDNQWLSTRNQRWLKITVGHHGKPVDQRDEKSRNIRTYASEQDIQAATEYTQDCVELFQLDSSTHIQVKENKIKQASWMLAGISVLADWIGSNPDFFRYKNFENLESEKINLEYYWREIALPQAAKVLDSPAFAFKKKKPFTSITQQFDYIKTPTPLQAKAAQIEILDGPQLFILEDVTGAGKTEAAMILAHRLMAENLADGLYVGLPTMATANSMYKRLAKSYRALYDESERPSLVLAHGASTQNQDFSDAIMLSEQQQDSDYIADETSASNYCNAWFADSRKKALMAEVGVGTIDQAMLGVLPVRHQALRLLGLHRKILIIDEVHAYDAYMTEILERLIEYHANTGGCVILLSATLPNNQRDKYNNAFIKGLSAKNNLKQAGKIKSEATLNSFPWFTQTALQTIDNLTGVYFEEEKVSTRASVERTVQVDLIHNEQHAIDLIIKAANNNQCICWIRNTVALAQQTYQELKDHPDLQDAEITLFHSRYALLDRRSIEEKVLEKFNDKSEFNQRKKQILVATQVVEQSLDLDFDYMITDLAPIDLIIQRAGRLQRHVRDQNGNPAEQEQRSSPTLTVLTPELDSATHRNWLEALLPSNSYIYKNIGQQWLTTKILSDKGQFTMPNDARLLVESVYGDGCEQIPEALTKVTEEAIGKDKAKSSTAHNTVLEIADGYSATNGRWDDKADFGSRLTEQETVEVALVTLENDQLIPYAKGEQHAWALSIIKVPQKQWRQAQNTLDEKEKDTIFELKQEVKALKWLEVWLIDKSQVDFYSNEVGWFSNE